jgi:hypothetical protein
MSMKSITKPSMPGTRSLFETIESLHHATKMIRPRGIMKTWVLTHVDFLLKNTMQEGILNIKLKKMPTIGNSQGGEQTNSRRFDNRAKSIFIVKTIPLLKSFGHESHFVTLNRPISTMLCLENPLGVNNIDARARRNQVPSLILKESIVFKLHCSTPMGNTESLMMSTGLNRSISDTMILARSELGNSTIGTLLGLNNAQLALSPNTRQRGRSSHQRSSRRWR